MILINLDSSLQIQLTKQQRDLILNQLVNFKNEKDKLYKCYKEICDRLKNELDKNRQLSKILDDKEQIQKRTDQIKIKLEERLIEIENKLNNQLEINEKLKKDKIEESKLLTDSFINKISESVIDNIQKLRISTNQQSSFNNQSNLIEQTINDNLNNQLFDNSSSFSDHHKLIESNLRLSSYVEKYVQINQYLNNELKEAKSQNLNLNIKLISFEDQINDYKFRLDKLLKECKILNEIIDEKNLKLIELIKLKLDNNNNKSIDYLRNKLNEEEFKVKKLDDQLKRTELKLNNKEEENYKLLNEIEIIKLENNQLENDYQQLKQLNNELNEQKLKLLKEIEDLQCKYDDLDDSESNLQEFFEIVLKDKDKEIDNLNCCLNEINIKLRECLPESKFKQNNSLLDEMITNYKKFLTTNHFQNKIQSYQTKLTNESYSSLTPLESLDDNEFEHYNKQIDIQNENKELIKQIKFYKDQIRNDQLELLKYNNKCKQLVFQKDYLLTNNQFNKSNCQLYQFKRFKIVSLCLIACIRMCKLRKQFNDQLINDQSNNQISNVLLNSSIEKYSSFVNFFNDNQFNLNYKKIVSKDKNLNYNLDIQNNSLSSLSTCESFFYLD